MTRESAAYLRIGLLLLLGLAIGVGLVAFLGGQRISQGARFETYFRESVQGLDVGAPVKYRGVTLGRVTAVGLANAEYGAAEGVHEDSRSYRLVFVRGEIDRTKIGPAIDTAAAVRQGLRARLAVQGLTGLSYLELDFVDPDRFPAAQVPWTPKAEFIPSMPSTLSQAQDAAQRVLGRLSDVDFKALATSLQRLVDDVDHEVTQGSAQIALRQISDFLKSLKGTVAQADLPGLTAELRHTSAALRTLVEGDDARQMLASGALAAERLARVAAQLPPVIAALQATVRRAEMGTADVQQAMAPLLRDLQVTVENLRETSDLLRRAPAQALFGQPPSRQPAPAR